ncbi:MAG: ParM/StbA family protein [Nitrospirota bacterium]
MGLDVGFGYTKAMPVHAGQGDESSTLVFPSVVSPAVDLAFRSGLDTQSGSLDHLAVTFEGASYFVGTLARRQGQFARATLDRVRTQSQEYRVLFLTALALLAESSIEEYAVVTGLPVDDFDDRTVIEDTLSGRFAITVGDRMLGLAVRHLTVVPQPYGALMDLIFKDTLGNVDERYANARVGVVDIGFKTTDFVLMHQGEFVQKGSGSLKTAISAVYQAAIPTFTSRYPGNWDALGIETALRDGAIHVLGKRFELDAALLDAELTGLTGEIVSWIHARWSSEPIEYLIGSGGGSLLLKPLLLKAFPQMVFVSDPQLANVRGYHKAAWFYHG